MSSITHIVDDEKVLNEYEYDAWGEVVKSVETVKNRFKFNGQQLDPITQQYYLRARFYNPVIARFTQEDTYRGDGLNLYAYCRNNPTYYVDPTGNICATGAENIRQKLNNGDQISNNERKKLASYDRIQALQNGTILYNQLDSLGRPTGAEAILTQSMIGTGSPAKNSIYPPGFMGGGPNGAGHARGHLIGNQLGGSGNDPRNLVTLYQNPVNTPNMRGYENKIRGAVDKGETVHYIVRPQYSGNDLMPTGITMIARGSNGFTLDITILNQI